MPNELNFPFLETLHLKTIIFLAPDEPSEQLNNFIDDQDIELLHLGMEANKQPWKPISEDVVIAALAVMMNIRCYPIHVMCHLGRYRTGTVVGCLRKLQRWNLASIFTEYRLFAGSGKSRVLNEQFIELFDTDLVQSPVQIPSFILKFAVDPTELKSQKPDHVNPASFQIQSQQVPPQLLLQQPKPRTSFVSALEQQSSEQEVLRDLHVSPRLQVLASSSPPPIFISSPSQSRLNCN
eukprot:CAMPEP_0175133314 /NCGR_PEP_ID=MMETSP0087-20121206/7572_1 /TAXON_ID=136419 /ORGANISM="Unknown Unknown, Strain D1" /LENGTH=236 /DNA_ID=CAMNT_0016415787 /DNA_START=80 /DNA_END=790 /DNA_ORIENTATION=-